MIDGPAGPEELVLLNTRLFMAPREQVFRAWSDPVRLARWWGPRGFSNSFSEFDLRPGGYWRFTMHGPDGREYPNESRFIDVVENERIAIDHLSGHQFRVTVGFSDEGQGTLLSFHMRFNDAQDYERSRRFIPEKNEENLDKLEAELARPVQPIQTGGSRV